ncbi:type II restriction endonuclease [Methanosphaera sp. Vir-13MRS]|uniref:type II restriction endonuclease n=1 Tax=Candidatus Methanosphaera massiliense TaxID=3017187 RepID=UPI00238014A5|nr:type II restriction endonuclease [Candidatus Methanosphaera massiliense]MDE4078533.1 type II restriction endonuclease [Candidatus Methanosphaera massiliense]
MRDFDKWFNEMRYSINQYNYYVNFEKVYENIEKLKIELNIMNSLIGSNNIKQDMTDLFEKYPEILKCIPILLAVRKKEIYVRDEEGEFNFNFESRNYSIEQYIYFMEKTGLVDLIENHIVNNLIDYCLGVETGLDSNGRKNRGGHQMENLVESYIKKTGLEYYKEMYLRDIESKWNMDLSQISAGGTSSKRWDFVVKTENNIYVIETNFYTSGGSKLNETARSYKMISRESKDIPNFEFVWVTDGAGWKGARGNLEETFNEMEHLYNITDLEKGIFTEVFK